MPDTQTLPTITGSKTYTEATHTLHAAVAGAEPIRVSGGKTPLFQQPDAITAHHAWRTQLDDRGWTIGNIHTHGGWVDAHGDPHPAYTDHSRGLVIHSVADAPTWAAGFAHGGIPVNLRLVLPHDATDLPDGGPVLDVPQPPDDGWGVTITGLSAHTEVRHTVYGGNIHGATPILVPGHLGYTPDRWMRPERINVTYTSRPGPLAPAGWRELEVAITGPWVLESGEPDTRWPGCARAPITYRPDWVRTYVTGHWPTVQLAA